MEPEALQASGPAPIYLRERPAAVAPTRSSVPLVAPARGTTRNIFSQGTIPVQVEGPLQIEGPLQMEGLVPEWGGYGGNIGYGGGGGFPLGWIPRPVWPPFPYAPYSPMRMMGSWYQRPYPQHLDYSRVRSGTALPQEILP